MVLLKACSDLAVVGGALDLFLPCLILIALSPAPEIYQPRVVELSLQTALALRHLDMQKFRRFLLDGAGHSPSSQAVKINPRRMYIRAMSLLLVRFDLKPG